MQRTERGKTTERKATERGISLTFSTIIIIVILILTVVAILLFVTKGMGSAGGNLTSTIPGTGFMGEIAPTHWGCGGNWTCVTEAGGKVPGTSDKYDSYAACDKPCKIKENPTRSCICTR